MPSARPAEQRLSLPLLASRGDQQSFFVLGQHLGLFQRGRAAIPQTATGMWATPALRWSKGLQRGPPGDLTDGPVSEGPRTWLRGQREAGGPLTGGTAQKAWGFGSVAVDTSTLMPGNASLIAITLVRTPTGPDPSWSTPGIIGAQAASRRERAFTSRFPLSPQVPFLPSPGEPSLLRKKPGQAWGRVTPPAPTLGLAGDPDVPRTGDSRCLKLVKLWDKPGQAGFLIWK